MEISGIGGNNGTAYRKTEKNSLTASKTFAGVLTEANKEDANTDRLVLSRDGKNNGISAEDMTMEEYKLYIYCKISKMPKSNSRRRDNMVIISDAGYEAMKNDPEYEKWALEQIRASFAGGGNCCGKNGRIHSVQYIGGSKEDCRYESWNSGGEVSEPSKEETRRFKLRQKAKIKKRARYRRVLRENSLARRQAELDHIRGIYKDHLYKKKNICAEISMSKITTRL